MNVLRTWRAVRHLRPVQIAGQLRHVLAPSRRIALPAPRAPRWTLARWPVAPPPAPAHARWDGAGAIELVGHGARFARPGEGASVEAIDWQYTAGGPLFAYQLHFFEWARARSATPAVRGRAVAHWIANARGGVGWDAHPISVRTLAWLLMRFADEGGLALDDAADEALRRSLDQQLETLAGQLETRLQANHLLENRIALVAGGLALEGARSARWLAHADALAADLREQFGEEGAHYERSPMYHAVLLEHLLHLLALAQATGERAPRALVDALHATCARALAALEVWTHPDGEIALLGDAALGIAQPPAALRAYASALGVALVPLAERGLLRSTGHARLEAGELVLIASVGGPSPPFQPGHAHCDALAFELSAGGRRVVVDTGVFEYVPGARRDLARATRAHATLEVGGAEQAECFGGHRVGGRPRVAIASAVPERAVEATCAGWSTPRTVHRRRFEVVPGSSRIEIEDRIEGDPRPVRAFLPLAPGLEPALDATLGRARVPLGDGRTLAVELPAGFAWRVVSAPYWPRFGCEEERRVVVGEAGALARARFRISLER